MPVSEQTDERIEWGLGVWGGCVGGGRGKGVWLRGVGDRESLFFVSPALEVFFLPSFPSPIPTFLLPFLVSSHFSHPPYLLLIPSTASFPSPSFIPLPSSPPSPPLPSFSPRNVPMNNYHLPKKEKKITKKDVYIMRRNPEATFTTAQWPTLSNK